MLYLENWLLSSTTYVYSAYDVTAFLCWNSTHYVLFAGKSKCHSDSDFVSRCHVFHPSECYVQGHRSKYIQEYMHAASVFATRVHTLTHTI